jgi:hypothetical protein
MSALPHKYHARDRLHRTTYGLRTCSGHIMIQNRRSNRARLTFPPRRGGDVRTGMVSRLSEQRPNAQTLAATTVRWRDRNAATFPSAPATPRQRTGKWSGQHSSPITPPTWGAAQSNTFFTYRRGFQLWSSRGKTCAPRRQAKNALRYAVHRITLNSSARETRDEQTDREGGHKGVHPINAARFRIIRTYPNL